MSTTNTHSAAPFTISREPKGFRLVCEDQPEIIPIIDANGTTIAEVYGERHDSDDDGGANAHLFAAAPELLEALEKIIAWIDAGCDPSRFSVENARAAIAKATGRS